MLIVAGLNSERKRVFPCLQFLQSLLRCLTNCLTGVIQAMLQVFFSLGTTYFTQRLDSGQLDISIRVFDKLYEMGAASSSPSSLHALTAS